MELLEASRANKELLRLAVVAYEGDVDERGLYDGQGQSVLAGSQHHEGQYTEGYVDGKGLMTWGDETHYEGEFQNNRVSGHGNYHWRNGSSFTGDLEGGLRHGRGRFGTGRSVAYYKGEWKHGERDGQGFLHFSKGQSYEGEWKGHVRCGQGRRVYRGGNVYEGAWEDNVRHGRGRMWWVERHEVYDGEWERGLQHGHGEHVWLQTRLPGSQFCRHNRYVGQFVRGKRQGQGTFFYANSAEYTGEWNDNVKHGHGRYTFPNGAVYEGRFEQDRMVEEVDPQARAMLLHDFDDLCPSDAAHKQQLDNAVLRAMSDLRRIYSFYASRGPKSEHNLYTLTRLQFHRLVKDMRLHQLEGRSLNHYDQIIGVESGSAIPGPADPFFFRHLLHALVRIAFDLFSDSFSTSSCVLADCFDALVAEHLLPNACALGGPLFGDEACLQAVLPLVGAIHEQLYIPLCTATQRPTARAALVFLTGTALMAEGAPLRASDVFRFLERDQPQAFDDGDANLQIELGLLDFVELLLLCCGAEQPPPEPERRPYAPRDEDDLTVTMPASRADTAEPRPTAPSCERATDDELEDDPTPRDSLDHDVIIEVFEGPDSDSDAVAAMHTTSADVQLARLRGLLQL